MTQNIKNPELKKPTPATYDPAGNKSPLHHFFIAGLQDIYWAEQELVKTLPKMIQASTTTELSTAIKLHLSETQVHVTRLEEIFEILGIPAEAKKCFAMEGLVREGDSIIEETLEGSKIRDAGIIMAAQKVEHYEIASYGSLVDYAKTLGLNSVRGILQATLEDEKMADHSLTLIAQNKINWEAEVEE